jgi:hypothetical protein
MNQIIDLVGLAQSMPFAIDLRVIQNLYYRMQKSIHGELQKRAEKRDQASKDWVTQFVSLGDKLSMCVD